MKKLALEEFLLNSKGVWGSHWNYDYRYLVGGRRVHKFGYRLKRFKDDPHLIYKEGLTEAELAEINNLPRIWDAGKIRFVKPKKR